jgi:hypothetical protein
VPRNDATYFSGDTSDLLVPIVELDNFTSSPTSNEVIAFPAGRPPSLAVDVPWSPAPDTIDVEADLPYRIPVQVWVVNGSFEESRERAIEDGLEAAMIWHDERQGIEFSRFEIADATSRPAAWRYEELDCSQARLLSRGVGRQEDAINVYYSTKVFVNGEPTRYGARWCPDDRIVLMGEAAFGALLTHELGHAFGLRHIDHLSSGFDATNVMHSRSASRRYLTEGQTFRAVHDPLSVINTFFWMRLGQPLRFCATSTSTDHPRCPAIQKRIWADGDWPAN